MTKIGNTECPNKFWITTIFQKILKCISQKNSQIEGRSAGLISRFFRLFVFLRILWNFLLNPYPKLVGTPWIKLKISWKKQARNLIRWVRKIPKKSWWIILAQTDFFTTVFSCITKDIRKMRKRWNVAVIKFTEAESVPIFQNYYYYHIWTLLPVSIHLSIFK